MKAARWYGRQDVRLEDIAPCAPGPDHLQVRIQYAGICATDLHEYTHGPQFIPIAPHPLTGRCAPITMGHEFTGTIVAVGSDVRHLKPGDRIVAEASIPCRQCCYCRRREFILCRQAAYLGFAWDGAFAEFCTLPAVICHRVPDALQSADAVIIEPLASVLHAVRRGRWQPGDTAAIIGNGHDRFMYVALGPSRWGQPRIYGRPGRQQARAGPAVGSGGGV